MKILLLGQSGQVGWELQRSLAVLGQVVALGRNNHDYCGNVSDPEGGRLQCAHSFHLWVDLYPQVSCD